MLADGGDAPAFGEPDAGDDRTNGAGVKWPYQVTLVWQVCVQSWARLAVVAVKTPGTPWPRCAAQAGRCPAARSPRP